MARNGGSIRIKASYVLLLVTAFTVAILVIGAKGAMEKTLGVRVVEVEMGPFEATLSMDGLLQFEGMYPGIALLSGQVEQVYVKPGDTVEKGQAILRLDTENATALLEKAYAQKESAQAFSSVYDEQISALLNQLEQSTIRAHRDGHVLNVNASPGMVLLQGNVGAVLSGAGQEVVLAAQQKDILSVQVGMNARLYNGDEFICNAVITQADSLYTDSATGQSMGQVVLTPDEWIDMRAGSRLRAEVVLLKREVVAQVSADALDSMDRLWQVYHGRIFPLENKVRLCADDMAWLEGVEAGTQVVYLPDEGLEAGQRIKEMAK